MIKVSCLATAISRIRQYRMFDQSINTAKEAASEDFQTGADVQKLSLTRMRRPSSLSLYISKNPLNIERFSKTAFFKALVFFVARQILNPGCRRVVMRARQSPLDYDPGSWPHTAQRQLGSAG